MDAVMQNCIVCGEYRACRSGYCLRCYTFVKKFKGQEFKGVCGLTVTPAPEGRGDPCLDCPMGWYEQCLDIAAIKGWPGWRVE